MSKQIVGWVDSSRQAVEFAMDPRNFLNEVRIFQFEALSFDEYSDNLDAVEKILYGTEFYNKIVEYITIAAFLDILDKQTPDKYTCQGQL